jgi:hypothetical protein
VRCEEKARFDRCEHWKTHRRLKMRTNLTTILASLGIAAALASPVMAKTERHHAAPAPVAVPSDTRGSAERTTEGNPYTPNMPTPVHGLSPDFQDGSRG